MSVPSQFKTNNRNHPIIHCVSSPRPTRSSHRHPNTRCENWVPHSVWVQGCADKSKPSGQNTLGGKTPSYYKNLINSACMYRHVHTCGSSIYDESRGVLSGGGFVRAPKLLLQEHSYQIDIVCASNVSPGDSTGVYCPMSPLRNYWQIPPTICEIYTGIWLWNMSTKKS